MALSLRLERLEAVVSAAREAVSVARAGDGHGGRVSSGAVQVKMAKLAEAILELDNPGRRPGAVSESGNSSTKTGESN